MALAERVKAALEGLQIWEDTCLKDVRDELKHLARREAAVTGAEPHAEPGEAADEAGTVGRDTGGRFTAAASED